MGGAMKNVALIYLCLLLFLGCALIRIERKVENNTFYSSRLPKMIISVDKSLKFRDHFDRNIVFKAPDYAETVNLKSYLFTKLDEKNCVKEIFAILLWKFNQYTRLTLSSGDEKINVGGIKFRSKTGINTIEKLLNDFKLSFLIEEGYSFSYRYTYMTLGKVFGQSNNVMWLVYLDDLSDDDDIWVYEERILQKGLKKIEVVK